MDQTATTATEHFRTELQALKLQIDRDIDGYWQDKLSHIGQEYGSSSERAMSTFAEMMGRGGKRIRGALAAHSYQLFGGRDADVAMNAARIVEMIHTYVLIIDDVCDRSDKRRGSATTHRALEAWHRESGLHGDAGHFGESMAILAALAGAHEALLAVGRLNAPADQRLAASDNLNYLLTVTCHGQFNDIMNEASRTGDQEQVEHVLLWKTAYYTFANPLQFGAILAGANQAELDQLLAYSLAAGRAFQIADDIIGIYGDEAATGKSPMDDIKEGKRTILTVKALEAAPKRDARFLESMLGNTALSLEELERCRKIIQRSGALDYAKSQLNDSVLAAQQALRGGVLPEEAPAVHFLDGLAQFMKNREA